MSTQSTTITLQTTGVEVEKKEKAEQVVRAAGFGSLQNVIRIFVTDIAEGRVPIRMQWTRPLNDSETLQSLEEYKQGNYRSLASQADIDEFIDG